jgi:osmotically-inducible protein OsmY
MRSDAQLRSDIVAELSWDPAITATDVGVIVKDGVVTLTGHPSSHAEKYAIERAARRVKGVKALAIEMPVKLASDYTRTDADIAMAVERAIEWNVLVPDDKIHPMVEVAVRDLLGVTGVSNRVVVKPKFTAADVEKKIREALERQADREAERIKIEVNGAHVTLSGKVHTWAERKAAQGAAWSAPGVANVINNLLVEA